jgi:hypothetical protein
MNSCRTLPEDDEHRHYRQDAYAEIHSFAGQASKNAAMIVIRKAITPGRLNQLLS